MQAIKSELLELLGRNDLMRSALLTGKIGDVAFESDDYVERVLELSARVWHRCSRAKNDVILKLESISHALFRDFGLEGKTDRYKQVIDDPHRFYIHHVLERKQASPLAAALIYAILCEQVGIKYECIALPSYYLLKVRDVVGDFYVDPFDSGKLLTEEDFNKKFRSAMQRHRMVQANLFEKITGTQLVARLAQQLKHIYILKGNALEALRAVEFLTALFPQSPELTRDRGILYCEMEYFSRAMADLKFYLQERPNADDVAEIKKLTTMLKGYREIVN